MKHFILICIFGMSIQCHWHPHQDRAFAYHEMLNIHREKFEFIVQCFKDDPNLERIIILDQGIIEVNCNDCQFNRRRPTVHWHVNNGKRVITKDQLSIQHFKEYPYHQELLEILLELKIDKVVRVSQWKLLFLDIELGQKSVFGLVHDLGTKESIRTHLLNGKFINFDTIPLEDTWYYFSD